MPGLSNWKTPSVLPALEQVEGRRVVEGDGVDVDPLARVLLR